MAFLETLLLEREKEGRPVRVAIAGAGVAARMAARQLLTPAPGIRLVAIANRTPDRATQIFKNGGAGRVAMASSVEEIEQAVDDGNVVVTADPLLICQAANIDVVIEATGTVEFAAHIAMAAIRHRKHVVLVNAELDSTLGPILKYHADRAGVVITNTDGDEPGVAMTLLRYLRMLGLRPVAAGNLKGMIDVYRTPETQREFAAKHKLNPMKATSFADGTKLSMEAALIANATGFRVGQRGMYGPRCAHVREMANLLPLDKLITGGLVDYALGAEPHTGAFVMVYEEHPGKQQDFAYYKMGDGPLYVFYTPYHLPHLQICATIGSAALLLDATVAPKGAPVCEVAALAKRDLKPGEILDGPGGFLTYGVIENSDVFSKQDLLPIGISEGCRLIRQVAKDTAVTNADVELPKDRLCDRLREEQRKQFSERKTGL